MKYKILNTLLMLVVSSFAANAGLLTIDQTREGRDVTFEAFDTSLGDLISAELSLTHEYEAIAQFNSLNECAIVTCDFDVQLDINGIFAHGNEYVVRTIMKQATRVLGSSVLLKTTTLHYDLFKFLDINAYESNFTIQYVSLLGGICRPLSMGCSYHGPDFNFTEEANTFNTRMTYKYKEASVKVPEPSTFAIFALGMMGLASRRLKTQA